MIKLRTLIDYQTFKNYYLFNLKRRKSFIILMILGVLGIIYTGISLVSYSINDKEITLSCLAPFLVLMGIYIVYIILIIWMIHSSYKKNSESFKTPLIYYFFSNHFEIEVEGAIDTSKRVKVNYSDLVLIYDSPNIYYLICNNKKMYIVKKDFILGSSVDLNLIFRSISNVTLKKAG